MTASKKSFGTNFAKLDAHAIAPEEYEDVPELDEGFFEEADEHVGGKLVRRGRPRSANPKETVTIRLDGHILKFFRDQGPGWQTRINDTLAAVAGVSVTKKLKPKKLSLDRVSSSRPAPSSSKKRSRAGKS